MEEVGVTMDVQDKWRELRSQVETQKNQISSAAEKSFVKKLFEKGGVWAVLGSFGISVLSWLGFKNAKKLKESIKEKGYLRTAVENAKEHPIFTAFLTALGVGAGSQAFSYLSENAAGITKALEEKSKESNVSMAQTVADVANKMRGAIATGADASLRGLTKGLAGALGGEYDEETGVVTLPYATIRPPVVVAWQAGVRRRMGIPLPVVEDRLKAILNQTNIVAQQSQGLSGHKKKLASRALELMKKGAFPGNATKEGLEFERIINTLNDDLKLDKAPTIDANEVRYNPAEAEKKIKILEAEMERVYKTETEDFATTRDAVHNKLYDAEKDLASGDFKGSAETRKKSAIADATSAMDTYKQKLLQQKLPLAQQLEQVMSEIGAADGAARNTLDSKTAGGRMPTQILETSSRKIEKLGYAMRKNAVGKYVLGGIVGYSFLPLALEGVASLRAGEKGREAREAWFKDIGEAAGGFVPIVGEALDIRGAVLGKDLNGRELDTWQRVNMGMMGGLGTVSLILAPFSGGLSVIGFRTARGLFAAHKAAKIAKLASQGIEIKGATDKSIKALKAGTKNKEVLEKMLKITDTQKNIRTARNVVQNAQRTMQVATYGHLGFQVASGVASIYGNAEDLVGNVQQKASDAVTSVEQFITSKPA